MQRKKKNKKQSDYPVSKCPIEKIDVMDDENYDGTQQQIICPNCSHVIPYHNEIEINKKGGKCKCIPCSFKATKGNKTMNIDRRDNGDINVEIDSHFINFSFNRNTTPEEQPKSDTGEVIKKILDK